MLNALRWKSARCGSRFSVFAMATALIIGAAVFAPAAWAGQVHYDSFSQWLSQTKVTGQFRAYYLTKHYQYFKPFQHSGSVGGWLNIDTAPFHDFSADLGVYTAQSLGLNPTNPVARVTELPADNVTTLGQAYLQFKSSGFTVRGGNQAINTPFANNSDFRMIPATFQGVSAVWASAAPGLTLSFYRMFRFKPWWASGFERTDTGKSPYNGIAQVPAVDSGGFAAFGAKYARTPLDIGGWYYDFYNRLSLGYGEVHYHVGIGGHFLKALILGGQAAREWNTGNQADPYRDVNSTLYGAQVGFAVPHNVIFASYNRVPIHDGSFQAGGFVDPYLQGNFNSSPIFTDIFGMSMGSQFGVPGHGYSIKDVIKLNRLILIPAYTTYDFVASATGPGGQTVNGPGSIHGYMLIAKYNLTNHWQFEFDGAYKQSKAPIGKVALAFFDLRYTFGGGA